ncbi:hypothetical protein IAU59_005290 [Kwoniella sp. CBS 9459]
MSHISSLQARWALDIFVVVLSSIGVISAIPSFKEETESYYPLGDVRGPMLILGSVGVMVALLSRIGSSFTPSSCKPLTERLEFTFIAMLWICWTSATMSFSLFTLNQSTCQPAFPDHMLPSCPLLTFDLTLLHLLSITSFIQLLMILSSILSAFTGLSKSGDIGAGAGGEGFVMWELALASPSASPMLKPQRSLSPSDGAAAAAAGPSSDPSISTHVRSYGATSTQPPPISVPSFSLSQEPSMPGTHCSESSAESSPSRGGSSSKKDKFAIGRLRTYIPLSIASLSVGCGAIAANLIGESAPSGIFLAVVAFAATLLSIACISAHFAQRKDSYQPLEEGAELTYRHARLVRALEVGSASVLFCLWPVAAIAFSLAPPSPTRACTNPAASAIPSPGEDSDIEGYPLCTLGWAVISLSWVGSWLLLVRIMGLIFPTPSGFSDSGVSGAKVNFLGEAEGYTASRRSGDEGRALLGGASGSGSGRSAGNVRSDRAGFTGGGGDALGRKGWHRVVAGEEFELGTDDDDEDDDDDGNHDNGIDGLGNNR